MANRTRICAKHNEVTLLEGDGKDREFRNRCRSCSRESKQRFRRRNPADDMLRHARNRADKAGVPFNIVADDIIIPTHCPVLGIEIYSGLSGHKDNTPSLDRLKPALGYVAGNIAVISLRANRLKSDGTLAEHERLLIWMRQTCS